MKKLRALARQEQLLRDQHALRELRKHFTGYEDLPTSLKGIAALPYHQRRGIRAKYAKVAPLLSQNFVPVTPKTAKQAKILRQATHQRFRHMKHFIVHTPVATTAKVTDHGLTFKHKYPGEAEVVEEYWLFPSRARGPAHMRRMLTRMLPQMPEGMYVMQTDTYGDTGPIIDKSLLSEILQETLNRYDAPKYGEHRFLNRVTGFRFVSSTLKGARVQMKARDELRDRQKQINRERRERLRREARRRAASKT